MGVELVITAFIGLSIGILSGLLGVGGGTIMVPVFRLGLGLSAITSTATSLFTIIPTSISGAIQHIRNKTCIPKLGVALGIGGACFSPLGVWLAQISPTWMVMIAVACAIGYSSFTMLRKAMQAPKGKDIVFETPAFKGKELMKAVFIGACVGTVSGYIGLGGGFLMIPLMVAFLKLPMKVASGTSLIAVMLIATPATVMQCVLGNVDYMIGIGIACGSIPGALLGAWLVKYVPERMLRFIFSIFLGIAAILLVIKELGMF